MINQDIISLGIDNLHNKNRIAVVVVGYNRLKGIKRLLCSLENAIYPSDDIPLFISIDASGDLALYDYVRSFIWSHGVKYVNIQKERLGLKPHIMQCGDLTEYFRGVIILEDDIFVSPYFYYYALAAMDKYGDEDRIAGVALYTNEYDGYDGLPLHLMNSGQDVFAWQTVCSWGEMYNARMWRGFRAWLDKWDGDFGTIDMSNVIKGWTRAWSIYFYAYIITTNRYFIYPYVSLTTNFDDAGGEHIGGNNEIQVSLLMGERHYQMAPFDQLVHYDVYTTNDLIYDWLNISKSELTVDFYGQHPFYNGRFILSPFDLPYKRIRGFRLSMRPWELNVKYGLEGNSLFLYDRETDELCRPPQRLYSNEVLDYFFERYHFQLSPSYCMELILRRAKRKLKRWMRIKK